MALFNVTPPGAIDSAAASVGYQAPKPASPSWLDKVVGAFSAFGQSQSQAYPGLVTGPTGTYMVPQSQGILGMPTWLVLGGAALAAIYFMKKR